MESGGVWGKGLRREWVYGMGPKIRNVVTGFLHSFPGIIILWIGAGRNARMFYRKSCFSPLS